MPEAPERTFEILIVEDNPGDVLLIREALAKSVPAEITVACDGEEAVIVLRQRFDSSGGRIPDLILLDLHLPRLDGFAVLAAIRNEAALRCVPVVIFSTSDTEHEILRCYEMGASCYVPKPFDFPRFNQVIDSIAKFWLKTAVAPKRRGLLAPL